MRTRWSFVAVLLCSLPALASADPPAAVHVALGATAVEATGLTPAGAVAWFGVEQRSDAYFPQLVRYAKVATADAAGAAALDLGRAPVRSATWVVVDVTRGAYATLRPTEGDEGEDSFEPAAADALPADIPEGEDHFTDADAYVLLLAVRPGVGAWTFAGGDGGTLDEDGHVDGLLRLPLDRLTPLGTSPPAPASAAAGDTWFVLEPRRLRLSIAVARHAS